MGYALIVSLILFKVLDAVMGLRLADDDELEGLDITQHSETAYTHSHRLGGLIPDQVNLECSARSA